MPSGSQTVLRLVEEQEPRMRHKGEAQLQTLFHARRVVLRLPPIRRAIDAHTVQRRLRVHIQTPERGDHLDVLFYHSGKERNWDGLSPRTSH